MIVRESLRTLLSAAVLLNFVVATHSARGSIVVVTVIFRRGSGVTMKTKRRFLRVSFFFQIPFPRRVTSTTSRLFRPVTSVLYTWSS